MIWILVRLANWHLKMYCKIMSYVVGETITTDDIYRAIAPNAMKILDNLGKR